MAAPIGNKYGLGNSNTGRPKKFSSVDELEKSIEDYFERCDNGMKNGEPFPIPYTLEGLAAALEIDRRTLLNYSKEDGYEEFFPTIKKAKQRVLADLTERGLTGDSNPAITIFNLKNNYGYVDKVEQEITSNNTIVWHENKTYESNKETDDNA